MRNFLKKIALFMLIAGLPLQNLHAVTMPFCAPDQAPAAAHAHPAQAGGHGSSAQSDAQFGAMAGHDHADHQHAAAGTNKACDGCSQCQACSAPAIVSMTIDALLDPIQTQPPVLTGHPTLFFPEQLQRPPSQFLA